MRKAFLVLGPEASGTRMLTEAFCKLGVFGDAGHEQRLDDLNFAAAPDSIVFRRSLPHGGNGTRHWPAVGALATCLRGAGYRVIPVLILRDQEVTVQSQLRATHVESAESARANLEFAVRHVYIELAKVGLWPMVVSYESFVRSRQVREVFFAQFGLPAPRMAFFDANVKYQAGDDAAGAPGQHTLYCKA
jgi:hypothetical protein